MEFYTVDEISKMLKISKYIAMRVIKENEIPAVKIGKHWRIPKKEYEDWIKRKIG